MAIRGRGLALRARRRRNDSAANRYGLGLLACVAALLLPVPAPTHAAVTPLVDCVERAELPGIVQFHFGYRSTESSPTTIVIGPDNYFSPPPPNRGQLSTFLPGVHLPSVLVQAPIVPFNPNNPAIPMRWILGADQAEAEADLTLPGCDGLVWLGAWQPERFYLNGDVVTFEGSTWVATSFVEGERPGEAEEWELLAAPAEPASFAGERRQTFNRRGLARVRDPNVERSSVILIQYADARRKGRLRPTNVIRVRKGRFVARGEPRTRFNYVIHGAP